MLSAQRSQHTVGETVAAEETLELRVPRRASQSTRSLAVGY